MEKKIKWIKRPTHLALALLLIAILGIGSTIAFFTDIEAAVNTIKFGKVEIETNEEVYDLTKENIGVTANGVSDCYVRMQVNVPTVTYNYGENGEKREAEITLFGESGNLMTASAWMDLKDETEIPAVILTSEKNGKWVLKKDGFWYLSVPLKKNESAMLLKKITYPGLWKVTEDNPKGEVILPDGLDYSMLEISIRSEAVQVEGINVGEATGADAAYAAFQIVNGE